MKRDWTHTRPRSHEEAGGGKENRNPGRGPASPPNHFGSLCLALRFSISLQDFGFDFLLFAASREINGIGLTRRSSLIGWPSRGPAIGRDARAPGADKMCFLIICENLRESADNFSFGQSGWPSLRWIIPGGHSKRVEGRLQTSLEFPEFLVAPRIPGRRSAALRWAWSAPGAVVAGFVGGGWVGDSERKPSE